MRLRKTNLKERAQRGVEGWEIHNDIDESVKIEETKFDTNLMHGDNKHSAI